MLLYSSPKTKKLSLGLWARHSRMKLSLNLPGSLRFPLQLLPRKSVQPRAMRVVLRGQDGDVTCPRSSTLYWINDSSLLLASHPFGVTSSSPEFATRKEGENCHMSAPSVCSPCSLHHWLYPLDQDPSSKLQSLECSHFVQPLSFLLISVTVSVVVSLCALNTDFIDPCLSIWLMSMRYVPTTISTNVVMSKQANGNQALTVVQSTLGDFPGPFMSPLLIHMHTSTGA